MENLINVQPAIESVESVLLAMPCAADADATARAHSKRGIRRPRTGDDVPPFLFLKPGMSPEHAAVAAVREMRLQYPVDALTVLWELRRAVREAANAADAARGIAPLQKAQWRPFSKRITPLSPLLHGLHQRPSDDAC